ncbi:MAG: hypothetical protein ABI789_09215, partial [Usitatibacter sp.]
MSARRAVLRWLAAAALGVLGLATTAAQATFTLTRTSAPTFYTDTSVTPNIVCNYQSFSVTSTTAVADAWTRMSNFGGGFLSLGGSDDGLQHLGSFTAGQTRNTFFYVCSSYAVVGGVQAGQSYDVAVYDRNPGFAGAIQLGTASFASTIDNSLIQAATNQVSVIFAGPNPSVIGGVITMTVEGDTGTIGNAPGPNGPLSFTPASYTNWNASAYELFATNVSFSGGNSGSFDNQLFFGSLTGGSATHYIATYYFRAVLRTLALRDFAR